MEVGETGNAHARHGTVGRMKVATHDGSFHADDVFAIAVLRLRTPDLEIVRTRDTDIIAACDARVDVGLQSDPDTGGFDHHQKGGAGTRPNGIPYASFGLVWRAYGAEVCDGDAQVAAEVDGYLVQGIDALDCGVTITQSVIDDVRPMTISDLIGAMNPAWDEEITDAEQDARFLEAVTRAEGVVERAISTAAARARAHQLVRAAMERADDPRLIELDRKMPWHEPVVTDAPEALYVIYPKSDGWGLQAVPEELGAFGNRRDLPESWAGLTGADLAAVTGVADAIFCHGKRFMAAAESREGVLELARQALDDGE